MDVFFATVLLYIDCIAVSRGSLWSLLFGFLGWSYSLHRKIRSEKSCPFSRGIEQLGSTSCVYFTVIGSLGIDEGIVNRGHVKNGS